MKKIIDAIKDFIYSITDYGLIIAVIVIMVSVLAWRFNILFNIGIEKEVIAQIPEAIVNTEKPNDNTDNTDQIEENPENSENSEVEETISPNAVIATVDIPSGSFPSSIGDILFNSNLIEDKDKFLNRVLELGLDTKLQSGTFEIAIGTSLDQVIKIIANAN